MPHFSCFFRVRLRIRTIAAVCFLCLLLCSCASVQPSHAPAVSPLPESQSTRVTMESEAFGSTVPFIVWLPRGYGSGKRYPVWYGLHGYSSTETMWLDAGIGSVADELIAQEKLPPIIMVFPLTRYDSAKAIELDMADGVRGESGMERFLCDELIPYIDAHYATLAAPESRSIGGFSMGGLFALQIGLRHPDLFGQAAGYSPALVYSDFTGDTFEKWLSFDPLDPEGDLSGYAASRGLDQIDIYLDCGGESDPFAKGTASMYDALLTRGIQAQFHPHEGGHSLRPDFLEQYLLFYKKA